MKKLIAALFFTLPLFAMTPPELHKLANDYYDWRNQNYPVAASDQGLHTWDDKLADYSAAAIAKRHAHVLAIAEKARAVDFKGWKKDDVIDAILFRSQVDRDEFADRVQRPEVTDPQLYVNEASNAIFSLIKKEYAPADVRARAGMHRLEQMPHLLEQGKKNLTEPVRLYAELAIDSARSIDSLFDTLDSLAGPLPTSEKQELATAKKNAASAMHAYADWLEKQLPSMKPWKPLGKTNYEYMLRHILLLPMSSDEVEHLGRVELARYRALEAMLKDPSMADPDPHRSADVPKDQQSFLERYQSREEEMIKFLKDNHLVTLPDYLGPFLIRQLPDAFKPTSPGGFMNPPGLYDQDSSGFYFIPTYNPNSHNFYIRAAIEDPRPILGHEGIPGHFLQLSIGNHLTDEIRRQQQDSVFTEGWALYGEEMLLREGLYPPESAGAGQILRLSRYRAARIGVDVNLHTGRWTFDQAVNYFMEAGGLDKESGTGEAAGAASSPTQKISYITGKWQIMQLLGRYRDKKGAAFRLGEFHDELIAHGSLPVSVLEWIILDDPSSLEKATRKKLK
ncbi:MAG TPA: DUF885 domain-containing protein [Thermoanaerobaculia bacterium]|nr:DUF885 domain-containing protein [Thermoanaerobaculia bacterium]